MREVKEDGRGNWRFTCSNRPRASVQKGAKGHQHWKREPFHIRVAGYPDTLCGCKAGDWLNIDIQPDDALASSSLCRRCAALSASKVQR